MKTNQGAIILAERAADYGRLRSVLREWGYKETDIQRFINEPNVVQKLDERGKRDDQSSKIPLGVS
jgi:hypothetical protein